jgi:GNAT superfamily N-acetyltransferase
MKYEIRTFTKEDISLLVSAFGAVQWPKPHSLFEAYLKEQNDHQRLIWVAWVRDKPVGYITLKWSSEYLSFREMAIPEIKDLNVLPEFRNQGIGSQLLAKAEDAAFQKSPTVGLGVGLYEGYGAAQQLYIKKGYIPNGEGITYHYHTVAPGESVSLDDELVLWLTKMKAYTIR